MKAIVGIDTQEEYKPAVQLLARFRFPNPETTLAHFVNPTPGYFPLDAPAAAQMQEDYLKTMENVGLEALDNAKDEACMRDLHPKCLLKFGRASEGLAALAEQAHADIVAVRTERGSLWSTSFLGSVSRSLTIGCRSSLLIAKSPVKDAAPLKIVLATDHSEESNRWIGKFLSWHAKGIAHIHVVTAYKLTKDEAQVLRNHLPGVNRLADAWIEEHLNKLNERVVRRLMDAGYSATAHVAAGETNDVIRHAMQDMQADVLVMGAQGHGFIDRLLVGSCSLHQVMSEPYPVLVVRS